MNNFMKKILEKDDYHCIDQGIELWNNNNEFFIIQEYDVEELESSGDKTQNFFTCEKTNQLISEFEKIQDNKIKKNTSLFVSVKVNNIKEVYERFKNIAMRIEEDEYYFRKYIIFYTDKGLNDLAPDVQYLLHIVQNNVDDLEESLFDKFEKDMFFDDSYFIAMQLIIKLPFISLPHSDKPFATIEDKIKLRMESEQQVKKEQQVNQILEWFDSDNIREQLENSDIFDNLRQILEE
ncbi:hypothetical protein KQH74_01605 [Streptococcus sanguinis]|jgi:hypothetical protein|uniref:Uncharacterized protein n=3 Tax=Streptococcus TaxID=1301 RepID=A0A3P1S433_STRSA|nr:MULTISPECIES: ABC-three component system middle component 1 [Streptococcus]EGD39324.1 hypothetical protein HMPREF9384_0809 [Streptococcus sanguinis SK160]EJO18433.1 hypothetical protein HMPREF1150_0136 [Streptococcus sp. AS14]MBF1698162.1 hypothetical protein [Streptococcus cristatus]MBF1722746.1 hypothetical protein [Streptococcus sp.]MBZ2025310.1 hypothetical protein [Streptococcus sanguinis]